MLFNSYEFLFLFLPITLLGYYSLAAKVGTASSLLWLVAASLFFYAWWNPWYIFLVITSIVVNYFIGKLIGEALSANGEGTSKLPRRQLLILGIVFNLGLLGYYKYANFFVDNINFVFNQNFDLDTIILPLAISFFTFQQIAFLVDAYRGLTREYDFKHYCLFVMFFPQFIAGPIVHHKDMIPQFEQRCSRRFDVSHFTIGATLFLIGLFKKVVIADNIAMNVPLTFSAAEQGADISFIYAWTAALAYTLQLYFDFSGYSDMAIGLARMFGIKLPLNFNSPYKSVSIVEFWRRWHMTLSRFLRDYLYIPLGGNQQGRFRRYINLMTTMLIGGLWHGAGWNFVIWGGLHGIYLVVNHGWRHILTLMPFRRIQDQGQDQSQNQSPSPRLVRFFYRMLTFFAVVIAWVFFRAENFSGAVNILVGMTGVNGSGLGGHFDVLPALLIPPGLLIVWLLPNSQELMKKFEPALDFAKPDSAEKSGKDQRLVWQPTLLWAIFTGLILITVIGDLNKASEFLYFQF